MTVEELRGVQDRKDLRAVHVVEIREDGFTVAHTDRERALARIAAGAGDEHALDRCPVHCWLSARADRPVAPGVYVLTRHLPDAVSEPLGADPWDLEPLSV